MKRFLINVLTSLVALMVFCGTLELSFRWYMKAKHTLDEYEDFMEQQGITPKNKKTGEKRIMIIGESSARGVPYTMEFSVAGFLQKLLAESGNQNLKVINTAIPGRHSFYQLEEGKDLIHYHADAVILYAGNNDARDFSNVMRDMPLAFLDFKLTWNSYFYWSFKRKMLKFKKWINRRAKRDVFTINYNQDDVWHWTDTYLTKKKKYLEDPELGMKRKLRAVEDYKNNLDRLTHYLERHNVSVFVCNLPIVHEANPEIGDWSRKGYQFEQKIIFRNQDEEGKWKKFFDEGKKALENQNYQQALLFFEAARKINTTYPMLFHDLGKTYAGMGDYAKAKSMYVKGKDLQIQSPGGDSYKTEALREVANKNSAVFVDLQDALEQSSQNGLVGTNLFLDHCHPNTLGHKVIAAKMMEGLCYSGFAQCKLEESDWKYWLNKLIGGELNSDNLAREYLLIGFYHFKGTLWESKPDYKEAIEYLEKAESITPENKNIYPLLAASFWNDNQKEKAAESLRKLRKLDETEYKKTLKDFPYLSELAQNLV